MDMSDSPLFSSGGTGPSTSEMFGNPPGMSNTHFSFSRSADLMAQSSEIAHIHATRMDSEFNSYHVVNSVDDLVADPNATFNVHSFQTEMTQEIDMDEAATSLNQMKEASRAWDTPGGKQGGYLLGRHRECDVIFDSSLISNRHCLIYKVTERRPIGMGDQGRERVFVEDLSSNGTFINGVKIGRGNRRELNHGDELQLAIWTAGSDIPYFYDKFYMFLKPNSDRIEKFDDSYWRFATVKLALERRTGQLVAVKIMDKRALYKRGQPNQQTDQETRILMALDHPCIVKIHEVFNEDHFYMVLEYLQGGELFDRIKKKRCFTEPEARIIFLQLFHAIKYLHNRDITHRDLKPENILMVDNTSLRLKISDFGLAKMVSEETFLHTLCGTPSYVAPEIFNGQSQRAYTKAVDMWSCGVILYVCLSNIFAATRGPLSLQQQIQQGLYHFNDPVWRNVSESGKDLIEWLLNTKYEERATVEEALSHPWMQATDLTVGQLDEALLRELRTSFVNTRSLRREPTVLANEDINNYGLLTAQFNNLNAHQHSGVFVTPSQSFAAVSEGVEVIHQRTPDTALDGSGTPNHGRVKRNQFTPLPDVHDSTAGTPVASATSKRPRCVQPTWKH
ncbi:kinase-like domain-containing protein [Syncephalis plumigaleata]|nr:kinase-like domain-containing protein [Syncephalis plumigaleata]